MTEQSVFTDGRKVRMFLFEEIQGSREELLPEGMSVLHCESDIIREKTCWSRRRSREEEWVGGCSTEKEDEEKMVKEKKEVRSRAEKEEPNLQ